MLKVYAAKNNFSNQKKPYLFHCRTCGTITQKSFIKLIVQANTTVTESDALAVFSVMDHLFDRLISEGYAVQLPMGTFRVGVCGSVGSASDRFSPKRSTVKNGSATNHGFILHFIPNRRKNRLLGAAVDYKKIKNTVICRPFIDSFFTLDNAAPKKITPGCFISLHGDYLKIDPSDTEQGVFLYPETGTAQVRYRVEQFARNARRTVTVQIPKEIPDGVYRFRIFARPGRTVFSAQSESIIIGTVSETSHISR